MILQVKAQRSQFPYGTEYLLYNESRSFMAQEEMTPEWKKLFDKHGEKFFCEIEWEPGRHVKFVKKIEWQDW